MERQRREQLFQNLNELANLASSGTCGPVIAPYERYRQGIGTSAQVPNAFANHTANLNAKAGLEQLFKQCSPKANPIIQKIYDQMDADAKPETRPDGVYKDEYICEQGECRPIK